MICSLCKREEGDVWVVDKDVIMRVGPECMYRLVLEKDE